MNPPSIQSRILDALDRFLFEHDATINDLVAHDKKFRVELKATCDAEGIRFESRLLTEGTHHAKL